MSLFQNAKRFFTQTAASVRASAHGFIKSIPTHTLGLRERVAVSRANTRGVGGSVLLPSTPARRKRARVFRVPVHTRRVAGMLGGNSHQRRKVRRMFGRERVGLQIAL